MMVNVKFKINEAFNETNEMTEATIAASAYAVYAPSSYRVKFERKEFLELVDIARPKIIYKRGNMHFFAFDGFVMYTMQCEGSNFSARILEAIEFSNQIWAK
jgi:hypothetical protein